ncbi:hypothetical protein KAJ61_06100 [Candidatus Parcubacteria bacterium]|nr:hypothetical protein [Candidatus Parcubacteria bacterium]
MACIVAIKCFGSTTVNIMSFETKEEVEKWLHDTGGEDEEIVGFCALPIEDSFKPLTVSVEAIFALSVIDDIRGGLEFMLNSAFQLGKDFHQKAKSRKAEALSRANIAEVEKSKSVVFHSSNDDAEFSTYSDAKQAAQIKEDVFQKIKNLNNPVKKIEIYWHGDFDVSEEMEKRVWINFNPKEDHGAYHDINEKFSDENDSKKTAEIINTMLYQLGFKRVYHQKYHPGGGMFGVKQKDACNGEYFRFSI